MTTITSPSGLITAAPERGPLGDEIPAVWTLTHRDGRRMGYVTAASSAVTWHAPKLHPSSTGLTDRELYAIAAVMVFIKRDIQGGQS